MAEFPGVSLSGTTDGGPCDHPGAEPPGAIEAGTVDILGVYPYEAKIRVFVRLADGTQEIVYTSAGGLEGNYIGTVEPVPPLSVRLRVQRLEGWPVGTLGVFVERE